MKGLNTAYNINTFDTNYRPKIDHDLNPSVDDISMPNGQHEISFVSRATKLYKTMMVKM